MTREFRQYFTLSAGIHGGIIVVLILIPLILDCRERKKPHEIITYVDLEMMAPPEVVPVPEIKIPEPPKDIPEPTPKKRKKIEISKKRVERKQPKQKTPELTPEEIRKLLDADAKPLKSSRKTIDDLPVWYYALVRQKMYDVWDQPGGLSAAAGFVTTVSVRVQRDGRITSRKLVKPSGREIMDKSVMAAVNAVRRLKPLPATFPGKQKDITIYFELTGGL